MPNIEDMTPEQAAQWFQENPPAEKKRRFKVREFDLDEDTLREIFGLVEGDKPSGKPKVPTKAEKADDGETENPAGRAFKYFSGS